MITLKKLDVTEHNIWKSFTGFIKHHPFISFLTAFIIILSIVITLSIVLNIAFVGAANIEYQMRELMLNGELPVETYNIIMLELNIFIVCMNYLWVIVKILIAFLILSPLYKIYKWYLKYRHDNL